VLVALRAESCERSLRAFGAAYFVPIKLKLLLIHNSFSRNRGSRQPGAPMIRSDRQLTATLQYRRSKITRTQKPPGRPFRAAERETSQPMAEFEARRLARTSRSTWPGTTSASRSTRPSTILQEVFRGCRVMKNGYLCANGIPRWGIEVDEKFAAKYPYVSIDAAAPERPHSSNPAPPKTGRPPSEV